MRTGLLICRVLCTGWAGYPVLGDVEKISMTRDQKPLPHGKKLRKDDRQRSMEAGFRAFEGHSASSI